MKYLSILLMLLGFMVPAQGQIVITEDISKNTVWEASDEYILDGLIFVEAGAELYIEPGTVIKGRAQENITTGDGASALIVRRDAKIFAEGTATAPIIFTAEADDVNDPTDLTYEDRGQWGGLIVLGNATTNQPTTDNQIEGIEGGEGGDEALYGGNNDADDSGVIRYVSIRHGGFSISGVSGDEINGLTLGGVGSGTTIEYVEVFANFDDGYEWFGGTVNTKYLINAFSGDDAFDYDQGFRGKGQFWFSIQAADRAGRGGEHDGGDDDETGTPYSTPVITNATYIGSGAGATVAEGDNNDRVFAIRDNAGGEYYNSIFTDFAGVGLNIEDIDGAEVDSRQRLEQGDLVFNNNLWWGIGNNDVASVAPQDFVATYISDEGNANSIADPGLRGISRATDGGLDPRPSAGSNAGFGAMNLDDNFFTNVSYYGAFGNDNWALGWTALDQYGYLSDEIVTSNEDEAGIPSAIALNQNYPNPFNPTTSISFTLPQAQQVTLKVYNLLGREVATLANRERFSAGLNTLSFDAANLSSGIYIYRLTGANVTLTRKMTLIK